MNKLNPHDAPEGYIAVKATMLCGGCKFKKKDCGSLPELNCCPSDRNDNQIVIFKKKEE